MIGRTSCNVLIDSQPVTFVNYSSETFRFLGCFLGDKTSINSDPDEIAQLEIEKHLKFFILKICYLGKVTHFYALHLLSSVCLLFRASIKLLNVDSKFLHEYLFCSPGVRFTKSTILTKSAFIGAGKNFI
ncbi:hypothetical protein RCL1_006341 [Eukaryota sp. TZLM3-RCL]